MALSQSAAQMPPPALPFSQQQQPLSQSSEEDDGYYENDLAMTQQDPPPASQDAAGGGSEMFSSQANPRRKYWAVFSPLSTSTPPIKLFWTSPLPPSSSQPTTAAFPGATGSVRLGRGPYPKFNDIVFPERRVSNRHCVIGRVDEPGSSAGGGWGAGARGKGEPLVYVEDLGSSNGTWVNGRRIKNTPHKTFLNHGDEVSIGSQEKMEDHDVRYIYRSVGKEGEGGEVGGVFDRYFFREVLGSGTFAEVKKAVHIETGQIRAIKCITKHRFANNPRTLAMFDREVCILETLAHENICRLIEVWDDPQHIYLVLEYVDGGDLLSYIMKHAEPGPGLSEAQAIELTVMICQAMAHSIGVTHRDLKPENILLTSDDPPRVKVADFGLAKMVDEGTYLKTMVGTPQYLAPEVVMQTSAKPGYENVVDSWSVGVIVYSMMTNAMPFEENKDDPVQVRIRNRFEQKYDAELLSEIGISAQGIDFIARLLEPDPATRMSLTDALQHPWLTEASEIYASQHSHASIYGHSQEYGSGSAFDLQSRASTAHDLENLDGNGTPRLGTPTDDFPNDEESSMNGGSNEDFSYPMNNLHLHTPGVAVPATPGPSGMRNGGMMSADGSFARAAGMDGSSFFGGPGPGESPVGMRSVVRENAMEGEPMEEHAMEVDEYQPPQSEILQPGTPSPPRATTELPIQGNGNPAPTTEDFFVPESLNMMDVDISSDNGRRPPSLSSSNITGTSSRLKRKLSDQSFDRHGSMGSSSPLSSLPDSDSEKRGNGKGKGKLSDGPRRKKTTNTPIATAAVSIVPAATRRSTRVRVDVIKPDVDKTPTKGSLVGGRKTRRS